MSRDAWNSRKPDYRLSVKERGGENRGTVGAAWKNDDGSISIKLTPCVAITSRDDVTIVLFPVEERS